MTTTISDEMIALICQRLAVGKRVRQKLPLDGLLHIDRRVPFLCVYRRPASRVDEGTERLVTSEASYLIVSGERSLHKSVARLVSAVVQTLSEVYGAFLIVELWSTAVTERGNDEDEPQPHPAFRIVAKLHDNDPLTSTLNRLERSLQKIRLWHRQAYVSIEKNGRAIPPGKLPLIGAKDAQVIGCRMIGLEIESIYRDSEQGILYPLVLRNLHYHLARALKQTFFDFSRKQTTHQATHYYAMGRQAMVKAVWHIDRQLADVSDSFEFLLQVTPINEASAWAAFKRSAYSQKPTFSYRPLPVDPVLLKRNLHNIRIEQIEDTGLFRLFQEKLRELDVQLTMLLELGTPRFLYGSLQLYGKIDDSVLQVARDILERISPRSRDESGKGYLDAHAFAARAEEEIAWYRQFYSSLSATVHVRDDINTGLMVSHGNMLIGKQTRVPLARVDALLHHEIGTHMLTYVNGLAQPFRQLYAGLAGYDELQEGLAVLAEYLGGNLGRPRLRLLAARVVAAHALVDGASFVETFRLLSETYQFRQRVAFTIAMRVYRGGGLTKDAVYLRGLLNVLDYLQKGGNLEPLFVGKIAAHHIPFIQELQLRNILRSPPLHPRYMSTSRSEERLQHVRQGVSVLELVERK